MTNRKEYQRQWKEKNREAVRNYSRTYNRKWVQEKYEKHLINQVRHRCKKKGIPFNLEVEDIIIPSHCPVLGFPLKRAIGEKSNKYDSPSLDRIDPGKGYIKGNVMVISQRANVMKNDATKEELELFADWVKNKLIHLYLISTDSSTEMKEN